jgi:hypothetical protein
MRILTVADMLGLPVRAVDQWSHSVACPWCDNAAWAASTYVQCSNPACPAQVATSFDFLAKIVGGYEAAASLASEKLGFTTDGVANRETERVVLDYWVRLARATPPNSTHALKHKFEREGYGLQQRELSAAIIGERQIEDMLEMAGNTGASISPALLGSSFRALLACPVQSTPYRIDRLLCYTQRGLVGSIVWHEFSAGVSGLLGASPSRPKLVAADIPQALKLQRVLSARGRMLSVSAFYLDPWAGAPSVDWQMDHPLLVAVPRMPASVVADDLLYARSDVTRMQDVLDRLPGVAANVRALPAEELLRGFGVSDAVCWDTLRQSVIACAIPAGGDKVPPDAAVLLERTGAREEDVAFLVDRFSRSGCVRLVEDIRRVSRRRTIYVEPRMEIKETASEYQSVSASGVYTIANFSLRISENVLFPNVSAAYCKAKLHCGSTTLDVLFPQSILQDRVQSLQEELQRQIAARGQTNETPHLPTIVHPAHFRKYILPHLKSQMAKAGLVGGTDRLGWNTDRTTFAAPGLLVTPDGRSATSHIFCPGVHALQKFTTVAHWASQCPPQMDPTCRDIVAMALAACARYFRRLPTRAIPVIQSSDTLDTLRRILRGVGQTNIIEVNINLRDHYRVEGIHGYPVMAAGPRAIDQGAEPFFLLSDHGYHAVSSPTKDEADAGGRALQFSLLRVAEWCLATGADEFKELPSTVPHASLLREGKWLLENVCRLQPWEVTEVSQLRELERVLEQIPTGETKDRLILTDGTHLQVRLAGLSYDEEKLREGLVQSGVLAAIHDNMLGGPAAGMLPLLASYYGHPPAVKQVSTPL